MTNQRFNLSSQYIKKYTATLIWYGKKYVFDLTATNIEKVRIYAITQLAKIVKIPILEIMDYLKLNPTCILIN